MNCQTKFIGWLFHDWYKVTHYPPMLSDGEGGCWAGHVVSTCRSCGLKISDGIWAASDSGNGKVWGWMRNANADELKEHGISN